MQEGQPDIFLIAFRIGAVVRFKDYFGRIYFGRLYDFIHSDSFNSNNYVVSSN